jgi:hypothetical protein
MSNIVPSLTGFAPSVTVLEDAVNAAPVLLDADVTFSDADNNFNGGTLVMSGLLTEDIVSIRNQGSGAGRIGFDSGTGVVSFGGVAIGMATGGSGGTFTVTFNGSATSAAIEKLIENLTYGNASDTPTASRTLTVEVTDAAGAGTRGAALEFAGPFAIAGLSTGYMSKPALGDLDSDGDLDIVIGNYDGTLFTIINNGTSAVPDFGAPVRVGAVDLVQDSSPTLGDLDGDGDLDIVAGNYNGNLFTIINNGTSAAPSFGAPVQIGTIDVGIHSTPALGDLDGDGDLDLVVGEFNGKLFTIVNGGSAAAANFGTPIQITGIAISFPRPTLGDLDGDGDLDIVVGSGGDGSLHTVINMGDAVAPAFGSAIKIEGIFMPFGAHPPALGDLDGDGDLDIVAGQDFVPETLLRVTGSSDPQIAVNVTAQNDAPTLTGFAPSITLLENAVNAAPVLLDADVTFSDADDNFSGGTLVMSGLLAEDVISIRNQGSGAGQIGFNGGTGAVAFGGVVIGTATGGSGGTFTVTFNGSATSAAIETLIENLTYANSSDTPTVSRTLALEVTDAAGAGTLGGSVNFAAPVQTADVGPGQFFVNTSSAPALGDLDGDGDLDIVMGKFDGQFFVFTNDGSAATPSFAAPVTIDGIDLGFKSKPALGDLDGDGDLDIVAGHTNGRLYSIENIGSWTSPDFAAAVPIPGIQLSFDSAPTLGDLDGDGDLDIVVGDQTGQLFRITNSGTAAHPLFEAPALIANVVVGNSRVAASLGDLDGDGDLDMIVAVDDGPFFKVVNTGSAATALFATPVAIFLTTDGLTPALGDLDSDGDLDMVVGRQTQGGLLTLLGTSDPQIVANVTAQNDAPSGTSKTIAALEDTACVLTAADFGFSDIDGNALAAVKVTTLPGAGVLTLNGALVQASDVVQIADIDAGKLAFTGALNANGAVYAAFTFQVQDNGGTANNGANLDQSPNTMTFNVTAANDAPSGTSKTVTALEDTARAFTAADFGFSDVEGNAFALLKLTTLPGAGKLTLNGAAVAPGQLISIADINAGNLAFKGALNGNGAGYAHFTFQVHDNGGTANGGVSLDPTPNTLTINVTPVNDVPTAVVLSNVHGPFAENTATAAAIKVGDIAVTDIDGGANILSLAGADAALFQIIGGDLWLKAGAKLDFETNPLLDVAVAVNVIGGAIDATRSVAIKVLDAIEIVNGDGAPNTLVGGYWTEWINGLGGDDRIVGNGGNDRITGGLGADMLTGGPGADVFVYASIAESKAGITGYIDNGFFVPASSVGVRDIITDFTLGQDRIDLAAIDANTRVAGNQTFTWLGAGNFTGASGQLIVRTYDLAGTTGDRTIIYGDVDGNRLADFQVELTGLRVLKASDFAL